MPLDTLNTVIIVTFTAVCLFITRILTRQPVAKGSGFRVLGSG